MWGRHLYNPDSDPQTWRRYLTKEFGAAAQQPVEDALGNASRILPLVTMYHAVGVANQVYWPEIYTNISIVAGGSNLSDNRTTTGASSSFDPQLFLGIDDYVGHCWRGPPLTSTNTFPPEVAQWLEDWANTAVSNLAKAKKLTPKPSDATFRRLEADVAIQSGLGLFFARKFRSAVLWAIYQRTGDANAKTAALAFYNNALKAWSDLAAVATPVYKNDLTYGRGGRLRGHWNDRVAAIRADIAAMQKGDVVGTPTHDGSAPEAIATAQSRPARPSANCRHTAPDTFVAGQDLTLVLIAEGADVTNVKLYYRRVNQAEAWQVVPTEGFRRRFSRNHPGFLHAIAIPAAILLWRGEGQSRVGLVPRLRRSVGQSAVFRCAAQDLANVTVITAAGPTPKLRSSSQSVSESLLSSLPSLSLEMESASRWTDWACWFWACWFWTCWPLVATAGAASLSGIGKAEMWTPIELRAICRADRLIRCAFQKDRLSQSPPTPRHEHVLGLSGTLEIEVAALRPCCLVSPPVAKRIRWNLGLTCVTHTMQLADQGREGALAPDFLLAHCFPQRLALHRTAMPIAPGRDCAIAARKNWYACDSRPCGCLYTSDCCRSRLSCQVRDGRPSMGSKPIAMSIFEDYRVNEVEIPD